MRALLASLGAVRDLALPPRCPSCGALTGDEGRFCAECWGALRFPGPPWCAACHTPFAHDRGPDALCATCLDAPPPHDGVLCAVGYGPVARDLALRLKYGRRLGHADTAARLMARWLPDHADVLVPVPLDRWRLWGRGFNQALLIARALTRRAGIPVAPEALIRIKRSDGMRGLNPRQRRIAAKGAFQADPALVRGKSVMIVDDVMATGATAAACARALHRAGAARVGVLVWARVLDGSDA